MNYKRLTITLAALFCLGTLAFGEIALKDLGNGQVAITFTYKDDAAPEMGVIGSFDGWTVPGEAMTKNDAGLWEKTIQATTGDVLLYKFYSKGSWIFDEKAPDKKDDGYGGNNGMVPVADILAGVLPAVPGAAPLPPPKSGPKVAGRPKLSFATDTYLESATTFTTGKGSFDVRDSVLNAKSIWKLQGDLVAGMPGYLEVTAFNGKPVIVDNRKSSLVEIDEGWEALAAGFTFNPIYYLGGKKRPTLDKFRFGFDTPYLTYETGYGAAPLPLHQGVLWPTVSDLYKAADAHATIRSQGGSATEVAGVVKAGDGYSAFRLGPKAKVVGDFTFDLGIVPNKSLGAYGLYSWASVEAYGVKVEGQLNQKSSVATSTDVSQYFTDPDRQDLIGGIDALWEGLVVRGQWLTSVFGKSISGHDLPARERTAYKLVLGYTDYYGDAEALFGYATRGGIATKMLYLTDADADSVLGKAATSTVSFSGFQKAGYWGNFKLEASLTSPTADSVETNKSFFVRPGVVLDFEKLELFPAALELYAKVEGNTEPGVDEQKASLTSAGLKVSVPTVDVYYKLDNSTKDALFNTVLAEVTLEKTIVAQAGVGVRSGTATKDNLGLVLGARTVLDLPEAKTPTVYGQFVYNMDPYNNDGSAGTPGYDLTDFGPSNGSLAYAGLGALRFGLKWNY